MAFKQRLGSPTEGRGDFKVSTFRITRDGPSERCRAPRADALPEHIQYRDDGCDAHPQCLTCPLVRCRYEEPGGVRALLNRDRDREIVDLRGRGHSIEDLAHRFGVSRRTVFRALQGRRGAVVKLSGLGLKRTVRRTERRHRWRGDAGES